MAAISLADNGSTAVRHEASNSRRVALSMSPMRYNPAAVSWIASDKRLRYFTVVPFLLAIARNLLHLRLLQSRRNLFVGVIEKMFRELFQVIQFPVFYVAAL